MKALAYLTVAGLMSLAGSASADRGRDEDHERGFDFGKFVEKRLDARAKRLFGIARPVPASSTLSIDPAAAEADPTALATFAKGLRARVVTAASNAGPNIDMMVLWPNDENATHLIVCNEQGPTEPGIQRIGLADGAVETVLTGTVSCDPVRRTPWGTVIAGEESGSSGWLLEIINPLQTTDVLFDRVNGTFTGAAAGNVATRPAVGRLSWEGIALYPNGVVYYGDEDRPATGTPGGAYFKFIPTTPWTGGAPITSLADSPLASGKVYGLRLGKRSSDTDYGQGSNTGLGTWVPIDNSAPAGVNLRAATATLKLTGYYRPEDADVDQGALAQDKVRFCGNNTGNEGEDRNWGETICVTDGTLAEATANTTTPELQFLVVGWPDFAMMDNIAYQPERGNWIIHEDGDGPAVGRNNDLWACLDDGDDADQRSDGCVRIATLNDLNAEWTGGFFDASGKGFFVSIQHNVTGHGVVLKVTGWR